MHKQYYQRQKTLSQQKVLRRQIYELSQQRQELIDQLFNLLEDLGVQTNRKRKANIFPFNLLAKFIYNMLVGLEKLVSQIVAAIFNKR